MEATAIFDIGKTNKKFLIFDDDLRLVHEEKVTLPEIEDEDGFPTEDLVALEEWMLGTLSGALRAEDVPITRLNISSYGASLVHLGEGDRPVCPLYNYLKPLPESVQRAFYGKYGRPQQVALETASPALGMLNSGLQLFWLKYGRPVTFQRIRSTLHLPQYLAFRFSMKKVQEYTSLGCHTALWSLEKADYHPWVYAEQLPRLFPAIGSSYRTFSAAFDGKPLEVGTGIHDSSAALLPYLHHVEEPFILLSTGTWSIALNPFARARLTAEELKQDSLFYLRPDGKPVKASRLFLGREHDEQVKRLAERYGWAPEAFHHMDFDPNRFGKLHSLGHSCFAWQHLQASCPALTRLPEHFGPEEAYHQLMLELCRLQQAKLRLVDQGARKLFVDGGFASNSLFLHMMARLHPDWQVEAVQAQQGTALGAALSVQPKPLPAGWLKRHYAFTLIGAS